MNPFTRRMIDLALIACTMYGVGVMAYQIYALGYMGGMKLRDTRYVKARLIKEGNLLKYPFRKTGREDVKTIDCDSPEQSGEGPEAA